MRGQRASLRGWREWGKNFVAGELRRPVSINRGLVGQQEGLKDSQRSLEPAGVFCRPTKGSVGQLKGFGS